MRFIVSALALTLFISCSSDNRSLTYPDTTGLAYAESEQDFVNTYNNLRSEVQRSDYRIVKEIDFKEYAESHKRRSRQTKMILFSNFELETPLIEENPEIGLEFPTGLLTYEDRDKYVLVAYNNIEYLSRMYALNNMGAVQNMEASLSELVSTATENMTLKNGTALAGKNTLTLSSSNTFNETFYRLRNAIVDNPEMNLVAEVDHQANARTIGSDIRQNKVLLFTTGIMEADLIDRYQLSSIDLPIRILVWEDEENKTQISYQDLETIIYRHDVNSKDVNIDEVRRMLRTLVFDAAE